jgi:hypothetical protein
MPLYIEGVPESVSEHVKANFKYDPDSGLLYRTRIFSPLTKIENPVGSLNPQGYLTVDLSRAYCKKTARNTRVHRVAWFLYYGVWPSSQIDHINGDKKDNRIENLRLTTQRLNQANRFARTDVTSRFKGVGRSRGKWRAYICHPKFTHLGYFLKEEDAAIAYDVAAKEIFGDHARLNFPEAGSTSAVKACGAS